MPIITIKIFYYLPDFKIHPKTALNYLILKLTIGSIIEKQRKFLIQIVFETQDMGLKQIDVQIINHILCEEGISFDSNSNFEFDFTRVTILTNRYEPSETRKEKWFVAILSQDIYFQLRNYFLFKQETHLENWVSGILDKWRMKVYLPGFFL